MPAVEGKVKEHLQRKGYRRQQLIEQQGAQAVTVTAIVQELTRNQGELLAGTREAAIGRLVTSVQRMVEEEMALQRGDPEASSQRSTEVSRYSEASNCNSASPSSFPQPPTRSIWRRILWWRRPRVLPREDVQLRLTARSSADSSSAHRS